MAPGRLRVRLAARAGLLAAVALALVGIVLEATVGRALPRGRDEDLLRRVDLLAEAVAREGAEGFRREAPALTSVERGDFAVILSGSGAVLANVGGTPPPGAADVPPGGAAEVEDPVRGACRVLSREAGSPGGTPLRVVAGVSIADAIQRRREWRLLWAAASGAVLVLVAAGAWFGAGLVLDPLRSMTEAARSPRSGEPGFRLPVRAPGDEFDDLAALLNDLLRRQGETVEAEQRFAGEAAHEMRAPLAVVRLRAEEALAEGTPGALRGAVEGSLEDVGRLDRLVQALLELSRAGPGGAPGVPPSADAAGVLAALREDFRTLGEARGRTVEVRFPPEPVPVAAPREVIETATSVLVDNALRYTPPGGLIEVTLAAGGGRARIRVRDAGPGVPADEADRVFDRFFRGRAGRAAGPGHGLGLALARRLARSAGGDVVLEDPGPPGACFVLDLPCAG